MRGLPLAAIYARAVRSLAGEVARARGHDGDHARGVLAARRTAAITFAKGPARDLGWLIGAAALVEVVLGFPGLGGTLSGSLDQFDEPAEEGVLVLATVVALGLHPEGSPAARAASPSATMPSMSPDDSARSSGVSTAMASARSSAAASSRRRHPCSKSRSPKGRP